MEATLEEANVKAGAEIAPAFEILETLKKHEELQRIAEEGGITPELLKGIRRKLSPGTQAGLKSNDIAFYLARLTLAGELEHGSSSLSIRHW
jgi:hypothetical protein